ncbi:MAG: PEGA domain-containing protein [Candidatus Micrarchaeota archaeon]
MRKILLLLLAVLFPIVNAYPEFYGTMTNWNSTDCDHDEITIYCITNGILNPTGFDQCGPLENNTDFRVIANYSGPYGGLLRWCKLANATGFLPSGFINVTSVPPNASVYIRREGQSISSYEGKTPLINYAYYEGFHDMRVSLLGYADAYKFFTVTPANITNLKFVLTPSATPFPSVYPYVPRASTNATATPSKAPSIAPAEAFHSDLPDVSLLPTPFDAPITRESNGTDDPLHFAIVMLISVAVVGFMRFLLSRVRRKSKKAE